MAIYDFPHLKKPQQFVAWIGLNEWLVHLYEVIGAIRRGKFDCLTEVTLTANTTTTTLTDYRLGAQSAIIFDPLTLNAAAAIGAGAVYVLDANRARGSCTITHANNTQTDRTFKVLIIG